MTGVSSGGRAPDLLEEAERALERLLLRAPALGVEVYLFRGRDRDLELKEGTLESVQESSERGIGLRLFDGPRMGFASAGSFEREDLDDLHRRALEQIRYFPPDEHRSLPAAPAAGTADRDLSASCFDEAAFSRPLEEYAERLLEMEGSARARDSRLEKILHSGYGESVEEVAIASSRGVRAFEQGTHFSAGISVSARSGGDLQVGSASQTARRAQELDLTRAALDAVFRTVSLLDARKLPSRRRAVLFDPWVAGELLDFLAGALSADAVQRGRSMFRGRIGSKVASALATFIDDPRRPGGLASGCFDDEGIATRPLRVIENGELRDFFYDSYTANKEGRASNGCAGRAGFKGVPGPAASNFYLAPGRPTREEVIRGTADGILVFDMMGMHTADAVSGEFSVGVSGVAIRSGEIVHGIRNAMIAANLRDLLAGIDAVADDLAFYGGCAAPTFRVDGLTVA